MHVPWLARLRAAALSLWAAYADDPQRRAWNARSSREDALAGSTMAIGWLAFVVKMWRLGEPGLALLPLSYVLHVSLQLVLLPHIRAKRGPWRELCYLTSCMHMVVTNLVLDLRSGVTILPLHGGSALRLAAVLAVANCSLIQAFLWPMSGFPLPFVALALPLVLPLPLASSRQICLRLLEDGAAAEPLATLHSAIGAAHSPFGGPYAWQLFDWTNASAGASHQLRQCLEVNVYLLLMWQAGRKNGDEGLALLPLSNTLLVLLQLALLPRVRKARAPWRELFYLIACLHMELTNIVLTLHSSISLLPLHGGSALRLAAVLSVANCSIIQPLLS
ncbi:SH3 domain-containing 19 isoform X2 [Chlorella sorokiniana]|uniref:SH3 domain-containing 19 isoform X2 n=1 Tax=Chlorella sorokiniana TaxID=3076 RepID=A0A2P6TRM0_CHLSO|nr:SH3 domain-containing 19 isoform X2 [Chlorella sorokiniana]|eukprot:PRW56713.1 SH3 domain-containing 19 isoform X2 [Chlorella sorokiniana]